MDSTYTRVLGGTTMHWEGKAMRMLPEDFQMRTRFGQGRDWPVGYDELEPHYQQAERELGVSADVADQTFYGITFPPGYEFPMHGLPASYLDKIVARDLDGTADPARGHHLHGGGPADGPGPQRNAEPGVRRRQGLRPRRCRRAPTRSTRATAARATSTASRCARCRPSTTPARRSPSACRPGASTS